MREFKISDINNLEKYVYETVGPKIAEYREELQKMGFALKSELICISENNDSLVSFTVRTQDDDFTFSVCFIANGRNGGYYVSPLIKEGEITNDVALILEQVKTVLLEQGFDEAKKVFGGVKKDVYKQNGAAYKILKVLRFVFFGLLVLIVGAIIVFLISIT